MPQSNPNKPRRTNWKQGLSYMTCTQVTTTNPWINNALNFLLWASKLSPLITIKGNTQNITALSYASFPYVPTHSKDVWHSLIVLPWTSRGKHESYTNRSVNVPPVKGRVTHFWHFNGYENWSASCQPNKALVKQMPASLKTWSFRSCHLMCAEE